MEAMGEWTLSKPRTPVTLVSTPRTWKPARSCGAATTRRRTSQVPQRPFPGRAGNDSGVGSRCPGMTAQIPRLTNVRTWTHFPEVATPWWKAHGYAGLRCLFPRFGLTASRTRSCSVFWIFSQSKGRSRSFLLGDQKVTNCLASVVAGGPGFSRAFALLLSRLGSVTMLRCHKTIMQPWRRTNDSISRDFSIVHCFNELLGGCSISTWVAGLGVCQE